MPKQIQTITFDNKTYEIIGIFEYEEKEYIALLTNDEKEDVYLFEYHQENNHYELFDIPDDIFDDVAEEFEFIVENQLFDQQCLDNKDWNIIGLRVICLMEILLYFRKNNRMKSKLRIVSVLVLSLGSLQL